MEVWNEIYNHPDYIVSSLGRVRSYKRGKELELRPGINSRGYLCVALDGKSVCVHRLVAETFIENPDGYIEINHIDGDKTNNCVTNLEWCDRSHNLKHAYDNGLRNSVGSIRATARPVEIVETGERFRSVSECARYLGVSMEQVRCCLDINKRQHHTCRGYHFRYIEREEYYGTDH